MIELLIAFVLFFILPLALIGAAALWERFRHEKTHDHAD